MLAVWRYEVFVAPNNTGEQPIRTLKVDEAEFAQFVPVELYPTDCDVRVGSGKK